MDQILNAVNSSIAGATIASGVFLKKIIGDKKIGKVSLKKFLPLFIFIIGELLNILYGFTTNQNIVVSISNGLFSTLLASYGYDIFKTIYKGGSIKTDTDNTTENKQ